MSIYKDQEDHLSPSSRRIAVGLTGLQKRVFSDLRKILGGGGEYKTPLFVALAAILAHPVSGRGRPGASQLCHWHSRHRRGDNRRDRHPYHILKHHSR